MPLVADELSVLDDEPLMSLPELCSWLEALGEF